MTFFNSVFGMSYVIMMPGFARNGSMSAPRVSASFKVPAAAAPWPESCSPPT